MKHSFRKVCFEVPGPNRSRSGKSTFKWRENETLQKYVQEIN